MERVRLHPPAWLPKASTSGSPGLSEAVMGRGSTLPSATNVTFQESSTSSPLESLCFLPETRSFSRHCQQATSRIQPPICARNLFGENKEGAGAEGARASGPGCVLGSGLGAPRAFVCAGAAAPANPPAPPATGTRRPHEKGQSRVRGPRTYPSPRPPVGIRPGGTGHSEGGTEPNSAFCLFEPSGSLTGHSEAPAPIWFPKSPHLERS